MGVAIGRIAEATGNDKCTWCITYSCLDCCCPALGLGRMWHGCIATQTLRKKFGLAPNHCKACLLHWCCCALSAAATSQELRFIAQVNKLRAGVAPPPPPPGQPVRQRMYYEEDDSHDAKSSTKKHHNKRNKRKKKTPQ